MAGLLTVLTALGGIALLAVLGVRTVLVERAVGRKPVSSKHIRTPRIRLLDRIAIALTILVVAGAVTRVVTGVVAASG